jgi:uncharacterized membrane protein YebE (DUF533 family)
MGLFKDKKPLGLFRDLVRVAACDGSISDREARFLAEMGKTMGLSQGDVKKVIAKPAKVKYVPPKDEHEKLKHLLMCVNAMMADGKIDRREMDVCMMVAGKLGLPPSLVQGMVQEFLKHVAAAVSVRADQRRVSRGNGGLDSEIEAFLRTQ